jgi:16S rRNA (cytosine967-C5)-methyltransferase
VHVAPLGTLGGAAVQAARSALKAVFEDHRRADYVIAATLRTRRDLAAPDHRFVAQSVFALFRWHGWVDALKIPRLEERLLLSWLLDAPSIHPVCRHWARSIGRDADRLLALGDAPNWTARAEGVKRWVGGRAVNADPWRLFPDWLRHELPAPPGGGPSRGKYLEFLDAMQKRPPLWVRAQSGTGKEVWAELKGLGLNPWVHRHLGHAAKLSTDADVYHLAAYTRGDLEIQDLASQAVGLICDPDPGERWWDACSGAGGKALHLAALMKGRGVVVASDANELRLKEAVRRARRSPYRNITTKLWNGKHVAGKPQSFDGVLVDAPCSAIGTWRRNPDARWTIDRDAITRLAELQGQLLHAASAGVKPGALPGRPSRVPARPVHEPTERCRIRRDPPDMASGGGLRRHVRRTDDSLNGDGTGDGIQTRGLNRRATDRSLAPCRTSTMRRRGHRTGLSRRLRLSDRRLGRGMSRTDDRSRI